MARADQGRRPVVLGGVQALRAVAAIAVVLAHIAAPTGVEHRYAGDHAVLGALFNCGITGVDLFFVISGFVMYRTTDTAGRGSKEAGRFLWRRATRIYPPYLIVTGLLLAASMVQPRPSGTARTDVLASFLILPQRGLPLLPVGWTLVYELFFYLVFAVILLLPRRTLLPALAVWAAITLALMPLHADGPVFRVVHSPLVLEFVLGVLVGAVAARLHRSAGVAAIVVGVLGASAVYASEWTRPGLLLAAGGVRPATIGLALALVVLGVVVLELHGMLRTPRLLLRLGAASYSIYLTHLLTFGALGLLVARIRIQHPLVHTAVVVGALLAALVVGVVFFTVVERPTLRIVLQGSRQLSAAIRSRRGGGGPAGVVRGPMVDRRGAAARQQHGADPVDAQRRVVGASATLD